MNQAYKEYEKVDKDYIKQIMQELEDEGYLNYDDSLETIYEYLDDDVDKGVILPYDKQFVEDTYYSCFDEIAFSEDNY